MPLPMVHLAVAVGMAPDLQAVWVPAFLLGSLAPDAIHMRPRATSEDKRRLHLHLSSTDRPEGAEVAAHDLLLNWRRQGICVGLLPIGYLAHILTDLLWRRQVWLPWRQALPAEVSHEEGRALYYRETGEIDRLIYERASWRGQIWDLLAAARPEDVPDLVSASEITLWRQRTLGWFERPASAREQPRYLTTGGILAFAERAAAQVTDWLMKWECWPPDL